MVRLSADLRHAWRSIAVHAGSAIGVVVVVGVGVGALSSAFALADPYLFRPVPYRDPSELVAVSWDWRGQLPISGEHTLAVDNWLRPDLFSAAATHGYASREILDIRGQYVSVSTLPVGVDFFAVLGGQAEAVARAFAAAGRAATASSRAPVVLTADGARKVEVPNGRAMEPGDILTTRGGASFEVLGILGPGFVLPDGRKADVIRPHHPEHLVTVTVTPQGRTAHSEVSALVARLRPGITLAAAVSALSYGSPSGDVRVTPVADLLTRRSRPAAWGISLAGVLILFVCVGNVSNLALVRYSGRREEAGVRLALGATRRDLFRLWALEGALLVAAATTVALVGTLVLLRSTASLMPLEYLTFGAPSLTIRVAVFAVLASLLVWVVGIASIAVLVTGRRGQPEAWQAMRARRGTHAWRIASIGIQAALAMILAVGASLTSRSYLNLVSQDSGYREEALVVSLLPSPTRADPMTLAQPALNALRSLPGVTAVAATNGPIVGEIVAKEQLVVGGEHVFVDVAGVTPEFFDVAGIGIVRGRAFTPEDIVAMPLVVNEAFARRYLTGETWGAVPVARGSGRARRPGVIVGVVRDVFDDGLAAPPSPTVYYRLDRGERALSLRYLLRVDDGMRPADDQIRRVLFAATPQSTVLDIETIHEGLGESIRDQTFAALVLTLLTLAGGAVAVFGIIGVVSHAIARQLRDLAIRNVLGARPAHLQRLVAQEAIVAGGAGSLFGFVVGMWLSRWLESLAYGVQVGSFAEFAAVAACGVVLVVAVALMPTRRLRRGSLAQVLRSG